MIFNTLPFLPFILIILICHRFLNWKLGKPFLLVVSYLFYASFNPPFVLILALSTLIDFICGRQINLNKNVNIKKAFLILSCVTNLGILCFFKYSDFLLSNINSILFHFGLHLNTPTMSFILPVGISFYTFQSMSYTLDIYRGKIKPTTLLDFALFVSFFTQLVAGPIVRASHFLPQLKRKKIPSFNVWSYGFYLVILGYFKKIVLADNVADFVQNAFQNPMAYASGDLLCAVLSFTLQIYCDFSGYSDIAIGFSLMMGLYLKRNFRLPYLARGFKDFWRRWHISLSTWIRDYVYIPLGGNRTGLGREIFNILFIMTLFGLWHGASWMFVLWGVLHGFYLVAERLYDYSWSRIESKFHLTAVWIRTHLIYRCFSTLITFALVCFAWILFRAANLSDASHIFFSLFNVESISYRPEWIYIGLVACIHLLLFMQTHFYALRRLHWSVYSIVTAIMSFFIFTAWESQNVFIYFQF